MIFNVNAMSFSNNQKYLYKIEVPIITIPLLSTSIYLMYESQTLPYIILCGLICIIVFVLYFIFLGSFNILNRLFCLELQENTFMLFIILHINVLLYIYLCVLMMVNNINKELYISIFITLGLLFIFSLFCWYFCYIKQINVTSMFMTNEQNDHNNMKCFTKITFFTSLSIIFLLFNVLIITKIVNTSLLINFVMVLLILIYILLLILCIVLKAPLFIVLLISLLCFILITLLMTYNVTVPVWIFILLFSILFCICIAIAAWYLRYHIKNHKPKLNIDKNGNPISNNGSSSNPNSNGTDGL